MYPSSCIFKLHTTIQIQLWVTDLSRGLLINSLCYYRIGMGQRFTSQVIEKRGWARFKNSLEEWGGKPPADSRAGLTLERKLQFQGKEGGGRSITRSMRIKFTLSGKPVNKTTAIFSQNYFAVCSPWKGSSFFLSLWIMTQAVLDFGTFWGRCNAALNKLQFQSTWVRQKRCLTGSLLCHHARNHLSWCTPKLNLHFCF